MTTPNSTKLFPELTLSELFTKFCPQHKVQHRFGPEHMFFCPEHNDYKDGEGEPSLAINDDKDVGYCHSIACGWKFNRYQLCKWAGALPPSFRGVIYSKDHNGVTVNKSHKAKQVSADLSACGLHEQANAIFNCHTVVRQRKCLDCGEVFDEKQTNSCGSPLCPICRPNQIQRFIDTHRASMVFYKGIKGITVRFSGKPLANLYADPVTGLQSVLQDAHKMLARLRDKIPTLCRDNVRTITTRLEKGIAWVSLHILFDGTDEDAELVELYFNERLRWSTASLARPFKSLDDALQWLAGKAKDPLTYAAPRDLEVFVYATHGKRLIQGSGRFYQVSGGKGYDRLSREAKRAFAQSNVPVCPKCGSTRTIRIGIRIVSPRDRSSTQPEPQALSPPALYPV